jgi:hypothetical protein
MVIALPFIVGALAQLGTSNIMEVAHLTLNLSNALILVAGSRPWSMFTLHTI